MNQYQTANQIAEDLQKDPRTVALELRRAGIQPDAELVRTGNRKSQPLYDREKIKESLAADLLAGSKRNAQHNFETKWDELKKRFENR